MIPMEVVSCAKRSGAIPHAEHVGEWRGEPVWCPGYDLDIYPVGVLAAIGMQKRRWAWLRRELRYIWGRARWGHWRAVKNAFNGYMAEPPDWPDGVRRCGTGWTKRRALRSWHRQLRKAGRL